MSIKRVAIYGGTGNLGPAIVRELVAASFEVTLLTRSATQDKLPAGVKVVQIDFEDASAITSALKGIDALVSAVGAAGTDKQTFVFAAALAAGVKHIIPSEFGCDTENAKARTLPVFAPKIGVQKWLKEQADAGKLSYTLVLTQAFLDWGVDTNFLINTSGSGTTRVYDGGDLPFSSTLLSDVGKAVAGVLTKPEQYSNQAVYVHSTTTTQNKLIAAARKAGAIVMVEDYTVKQSLDEAFAAASKGDFGFPTIVGFLTTGLYAPGYGGDFEKVDNDAFGIKTLNETEVAAIVEKIVKSKKTQS